MCWNAPVSLGTFLSSIIMCGFLWYRNSSIGTTPYDRPLALWIAWFSLMQLFEFFMWRDMNNHTITAKLALVTTVLQPFVLAAALYYYYYLNKRATADSAWRKPLLLLVMFISLVQFGSASFYAIKEKAHKWLSEKGPNCHLVWWYKKHEKSLPTLARADTIFFITCIGSILLIKPFKIALIYTFIGLISIIITKLYYPTETSSLWCWIVNIAAIITIIMPYLKF